MIFRRNINSLLLAVTLLLVIGFLITSFASYFVSRSSLRTEIILNSLPLTSDNIYSEIQRDLLRPIFISSLMANDTFLKDWVLHGEVDQIRVTRYLGEIKSKYETVSSFFISDSTGRYYYPGGVLKKVTPGDPRDVWYYRVRSMKEPYEINVDFDMANRDTLTIFINYRVLDYQGNYIGATGVGLTVHAVKKLIDTYQERYQRNIFFTDRKGDITLHGTGLTDKAVSIKEIEGLSDHAEKILASENNTYTYIKNGKTCYLNTRLIKEFNWYLFVEQSEDEAVKPILNALIINLFICIIITVFIFMLLRPTIRSYQRRIEKLATTDSLTGLHNRRSFHILMEQALKEIKRKETPLSLILIDLDFFKNINDTYGHHAGDMVLKETAAMIQGLLRDSDVFCRWGGEEFLILLKDCDMERAQSLAEKIRDKVEKTPVTGQEITVFVTISLGIARYRPGETVTTLIERADRALYRAKDQGRNRLVTEKELKG